MTSPYWPLTVFAGRHYAETSRIEYKIWANYVAGTVPPTDDPNAGAIFTSDGSSGLIANNLYYKYPSNGAIIDLSGGGGGGVTSIGPLSLTSTPNALSIAADVLTAHVASDANYGVVKGKTAVMTTLGDGAGALTTGSSIVIGNGAGATLTTGVDNVILGGDVDLATASNRIVLGNVTGTVDDQIVAPVTSLQFDAGFLTQTETDVLTISATGLVRKTAITSITTSSVFVNPITDHGAIGNGVADDTTAISASIDDAQTNGKLLYLPKGTFRITATITKVLTGLGIYAHPEAVLDFDHATPAFTFSGSNFSMRGGTITTLAGTPIIFNSSVVNVDIQDVVVSSAGATSFITSTGNGITIVNCNTPCTASIASANVSIIESVFTDVVIENNSSNVSIIACNCRTISTSVAAGTEPRGVVIENNTVTPTGALVGITIGNGDGVVVSNNRVNASGTTTGGISSVASGAGAVKDAQSFNKNTVFGGTLYGISIAADGGTIIEGNTLRDNTGPGILIDGSKTDELVVKGNIVKGTHTFGLSLPLVISEYIIDGNRLTGSIENPATSATKVITSNII
tara:strand:+ start:14434 stop:16146 length:1713 start_codon:yes stop_codon:yes gene_type:complete